MLDKKTALLYTSLSKLKPTELELFINHVDEGCINKICEGVYNIINTDLGISKARRTHLKKHLKNTKSLKNLKLITKKSTNLKRKREALLQEGSGLHSIFTTLAPLMTPIIVGKENTKNKPKKSN